MSSRTAIVPSVRLLVGVCVVVWAWVGGADAQVRLPPPQGSTYGSALESNVSRGLIYGRLPTVGKPDRYNKPFTIRSQGQAIRFLGVPPDILAQSLNPFLSSACVNGRFNLLRSTRYFVRVAANTPSKHRRLSVGASPDFNLYDPQKKSAPNTVYLFEYDGTSNCRVYALPAS